MGEFAPKRRAKVYPRPRFGVKLTPRLALSVVGLLVSLAATGWWAYRHAHVGR